MRWIFTKSPIACDGGAVNNADKRTDFVYDGKGRLRMRIEYDGVKTTGAWVTNTVVCYLYDGMRVIQERNSANTPTVSYTRGSDLSGSLEGAGGIGGLLGRSHAYQSGSGSWTNHNVYHADGNGNVTYMLNSSQSKVAEYRYDPFGNTISSSGTLATANVYRFSSKELHVNSGLYYYTHRFYSPNLQRWLNRDPIGEPGFRALLRRIRGSMDASQLYAYVNNATPNRVDPVGLAVWVCTRKTSGAPFWGLGRHAYLWDDRSPIQNHSCGLERGYGKGGPTSGPTDDGPVGIGTTIPGFPYEDLGNEVECYPVPDSEGHENEIMDHCKECANDQWIWPGVNDCHNACERVLGDNGYPMPPHRRMNYDDEKHWLWLILTGGGGPYPPF